MDGSPHQEVRLPESVERSIKRIREEKNLPPIKKYCRELLDKIGEQASTQVLSTILSSYDDVRTFSGLVSHLVKKDYPTQAATVLEKFNSPQVSPQAQRMLSPSSASAHALGKNIARIMNELSAGSITASGGPQADFAQDFLDSLHGFMQDQFTMQNAPNPQHRGMHTVEVVEQFCCFSPPTFRGTEEPKAVEEWILELERIFDHMECTELQKVSCAEFQLVEDARYWWNSVERTFTKDQKQTLTWGDFKKMMLDHYFPQSIREQMEIEFVNLKQETLSVMEYERRFNWLSRYAPDLVDTDERKARRFVRGLRPEVGAIVSGLRLTTYGEIVECARMVSANLNLEYEQPHNVTRKRKYDSEVYNIQLAKNKSTGAPTNKPQCLTCFKHHYGKCLIGKNTCFKCNEPGHIARECPTNNKIRGLRTLNAPPPDEKWKEHVSKMAQEEQPAENGTTTGHQSIICQLSFEDGTPEKRSSSVRSQLSLSGERSSRIISQQLTVLSKLEFRKLFLILSYIGRKKLAAVVTAGDAHEIYSMRDLSMEDFEKTIWYKYGQQFCDEADRIQYVDWDRRKTHFYHCHVCPDGTYYFKGPILNSAQTHLQRSLGDDNILIVKFPEDGPSVMGNFLEEGILVGLRRYRFFVFKDERKRVKKNQMEKEKKPIYSNVKCYFARIDSVSTYDIEENYILSRKTISEARQLFMHIHTLSTIEKYMARFSLILSKTVKLEVDFAAVTVKRIEDIPFQDENGSIIYDEDGKPILHTDGTGYISEDLAKKCQNDFAAAKYITNNSFEKREAEARDMEPPLLIQCRLFHDGCAVKGTLLINKKLDPGTIQVRPSMIKVEKDQTLPRNETFNSLEIVTISHRPKRNNLSKYLIALLSYGGVPQEFFLNLLKSALEETRNVCYSTRSALRVASNHDGLDYGLLAQLMITSGIPLNEPYLQLCLSNLEIGERNKLREGKIPISESFYVMGTADPTGVLNNDEVCVILGNGQISGKVLVYRNPGMHFGDIHIMEAVYVNEIEEVVGNAKYGIFFSTKGCRSAAYEMATGDFDGDMYWVSRNPELLKYFKANEPWSRVYSIPDTKTRNPQDLSDLELEHELFRLFLQARRPSFSMSTAADSWLTYMDRLLTLGDDRATEKDSLKKKIIQLIDIYYDALDAPKSGKKVEVPNELKAEMFPHHMEKGPDFSYHSSSILGQIYDRVNDFKNERQLKKEVWKLPCFDALIPEVYVSTWKARYENYRKDMTEALKSGNESRNDAANDVIKKYKQLLYEAPDMEESTKNTQSIYEEALAIYHVTYDYATGRGVEKCSFAWRVAGSALCNLYAWSLSGPRKKPLTISQSVLRELLN